MQKVVINHVSSLCFRRLLFPNLKSRTTGCLLRWSGTSTSSVQNKVLRIYTRTGDTGKSSTFTGERRHKNDDVFEALGTTDELSSAIGIAREYITQHDHILNCQLETVQCVLQDLASSIATPLSSARESHLKRTAFNNKHIQVLEQWIDAHTEHLPELKNFILPSGGKTSTHLHYARTICRRAERRVVALVRKEEVPGDVLKYLNRLSDYLFTAARVAAKLEGREEVMYRKPEE